MNKEQLRKEFDKAIEDYKYPQYTLPKNLIYFIFNWHWSVVSTLQEQLKKKDQIITNLKTIIDTLAESDNEVTMAKDIVRLQEQNEKLKKYNEANIESRAARMRDKIKEVESLQRQLTSERALREQAEKVKEAYNDIYHKDDNPHISGQIEEYEKLKSSLLPNQEIK